MGPQGESTLSTRKRQMLRRWGNGIFAIAGKKQNCSGGQRSRKYCVAAKLRLVLMMSALHRSLPVFSDDAVKLCSSTNISY